MDAQRNIGEYMDGHLSRRAILGKAIGFGVAAAAIGVTGATGATVASAAQTVHRFRTTAALNLRTGPGTTYGVMTVMPQGTIVAATGASQNGFLEVAYNGTYGWASQQYLAPYDSTGPVIIGTARTTANVNLRSGPSTSHRILRVVAAGSTVQVSSTVRSGFRYVTHNGLAGWIADQYLSISVPGDGPYDPNYATTTAALNLRAEPSLSARVLLVMPSGARVRLLDGGWGQFRRVSYNGTAGWAAYAYLN